MTNVAFEFLTPLVSEVKMNTNFVKEHVFYLLRFRCGNCDIECKWDGNCWVDNVQCNVFRYL